MNLEDLKQRHQIEEQFHDEKAIKGVDDFYNFGALELADRFSVERLGAIRGKSLLEIGCGDGGTTVLFAREGAQVTGIDISGEMVELAKKKADAAGLSGLVRALHMSGEALEFPEQSFDVVYGHSILHHLNLDVTVKRLTSVLKPGGRAVFLEPLDYNPVLNLFRKLTPNRRTPTEKPLTYDQLGAIGKSFSSWRHTEFYLVSLVAFFWYYGIRNRTMFKATLRVLAPVDRAVFAVLPFLRRYAWVTVVEYNK